MKPKVQDKTRLQHHRQAYCICLYVIIGIGVSTFPYSLAISEEDLGYRLFKEGDAIIGGMVSLHDEKYLQYAGCEGFRAHWLGLVEGIVYAIEEINKDDLLLPNFTLGYDIRDICANEIISARYIFQFLAASAMNCKAVRCMPNLKCFCDVDGASFGDDFLSDNYSTTYPIIAIVGALPSAVAIPMANSLQAVQIPYVGAAATSEELSSPLYGSFFRTIPSDVNQAKAFADIIEHFGWRFVAAVAADDSYGRSGVRALERESILRKTFCVEEFGYIPSLNYDNKIKMIVSSLRLRKTVKVVVVWSQALYGKEILKVAVREGLENRVWIFSEAVAMKKPEFLSSITNLSSTGIHLGVKVQSQAPENFLRYLERRLSRNHSHDDNLWWKEFWKYAVLTNNTLKGPRSSNVSSATVSSSSSSSSNTGGLLEVIHDDFVAYIIDSVYSIAHALDQLLKCNTSAKVPGLKDQDSCEGQEKMRNDQLVKYLKKVEFEGVTGKVHFDSRGDPVEAIYDIVHFKMSKIHDTEIVTKDTFASWNKNSKDRLQLIGINDLKLWEDDKNRGEIPSSTCTEECKPGQWKVIISECCWKCLPCSDGSISETYGARTCIKCTRTQMSNFNLTHCKSLPINNIDWSDKVSIILTVATILGIVIDVCVFGILVYFRDTPMVRALNKVCTLVLLLGIALCFGMTLLYIVRPSSGLCSVLKPLRYVVYTLCCSALFLKTMQIVQAFKVSHHHWMKSFICSSKRQVIVLLILICIEMMLGAGWIFLDPPYPHVTIVPKSHVFIACVPFRGTPGKVLENVMLVYFLLVAGCCIYYAFRARNLPANFNEAKHINFSLYIFLLSWITYYPVEHAVEGWYVAVLSGATLILSSYGLLVCMLGPKVYIIIWHPEKNTVDFIRAEMRQNHLNQSGNKPNSIQPVEKPN